MNIRLSGLNRPFDILKLNMNNVTWRGTMQCIMFQNFSIMNNNRNIKNNIITIIINYNYYH